MTPAKRKEAPFAVTWQRLAAAIGSIVLLLVLFGASPASSDRVLAVENNVKEIKKDIDGLKVQLNNYESKIDRHHAEQMTAIKSLKKETK